MILQVVRTELLRFRRDRAALLLTFILPIVFFTIFAGIFAGGMTGKRSTPRIRMAVADLDGSKPSQALVSALQRESALNVRLRTAEKDGSPFDPRSAEAAVRRGDVTVALIIPKGFGETPLDFSGAETQAPLQLLSDSSDPIASQVVSGLIQKTIFTAMPSALVRSGTTAMEQFMTPFTPEQRQQIDSALQQIESSPNATGSAAIAIEVRDVLGETKKNPVISFYAAGVGVMFLLFSATGGAGTLLQESESGMLDRILSSRVSMTTLLLGKLSAIALVSVAQLLLMFLWGALLFRVELFEHFAGFVVMAVVTAVAVSSFGLLLASLCRTRAQLSALGTLTILVISAIGGSMFPRFLMPESVQKFSLIAFNSWALEGFLKVFWRDAAVWQLWPEVLVLLVTGAVFFVIARYAGRRWELA